MKLEDAGFVMRPATTPEQIERLRRLPARQFIGRTTPSGRHFFYADPDYCKCVFVGDQRALQTYRDMQRALVQPDIGGSGGGNSIENDMIRDMDGDEFPNRDILSVPGFTAEDHS